MSKDGRSASRNRIRDDLLDLATIVQTGDFLLS